MSSSVTANGPVAPFVTRGEQAHRAGGGSRTHDAPPLGGGGGASSVVVPVGYWPGIAPDVVAPASIEWWPFPLPLWPS